MPKPGRPSPIWLLLAACRSWLLEERVMSQERRYSFEFFPTKTDAGHEKLMGVARQLATTTRTSSPAPTVPVARPATARSTPCCSWKAK
jgi:5,10-methylenetetrahydrofolate reductase